MAIRFFLTCLVVIPALLLTSCGRKGNPTLTTFAPPAQVSTLAAVHKQGVITLSWSMSQTFNLKGFAVERSEDGVNFRPVSFNKPDQTSYSDSNFKPGSDYYYRVRAVSNRDIYGVYSPVKKVSPGAMPQPPTQLRYARSGDEVELGWHPVNGVLYNVYKGSVKDKEPSALVNQQPLQEPLFRDKIDFSKNVYYVVRSLRATELKDEGYPSEAIMIAPSFFKPSAPSGIRYAQAKDRSMFIWDENKEQWVSGYRIYRKRAGESEFVSIGSSTVPAFTDPYAVTSKTFYFITATGQGSESQPSEHIEINPLVER